MLRELRIPRTIIAVIAGAALGLAGALMQSLNRNVLAEPGTLGANAVAAAGVVIGLTFFSTSSINIYIWFAFAGAGIASVLVHRLARSGETGVNPVGLVLAGAGLSIMVSSITTMLVLSSTDKVFTALRAWVTGPLDGRGRESLPAVGLSLLARVILCAYLA